MERDARVLGRSLFVALTRVKNNGSITGVYGDALNEQHGEALGGPVEVGQVAGLTAITLYLLGTAAYQLVGLPGPVRCSSSP